MPIDFRLIILRRLVALRKSRYWLAERVQENPSRNTIYAYLRGDRDVHSRHIARLFDALDLHVTPRKK